MMRFGLFGIPVTVHWWFWVTAALLSGVVDSPSPDAVFLLLSWLGVVFVSVLWHELGHALAFRHYGRSPEIQLQAFGGCTSPQRTAKLTQRQDLIVSGAGPVFGLLLWLAVYAALQARIIPCTGVEAGWGVLQPDLPGPLRWVVQDLQMVNLWWSLINLIPVAPLDGGRLLGAAMGPGRSREAARIGLACGVVVVVVALAEGMLFLAILFSLISYENWQKIAPTRRSGGGLFGKI